MKIQPSPSTQNLAGTSSLSEMSRQTQKSHSENNVQNHPAFTHTLHNKTYEFMSLNKKNSAATAFNFPAPNKEATSSPLATKEKSNARVRRAIDPNEDTQYPKGSLEHAIASALKAHADVIGQPQPNRYTSISDLIQNFYNMIQFWNSNPFDYLDEAHPAVQVGLHLAKENGVNLTGKTNQEMLENAKKYVADQLSAHGFTAPLFNLSPPKNTHEGQYYNPVLQRYVPDYIQINKVPGPDYSWHGFLNDLKEAARAPFVELGKEFWKITHNGQISPEKEQEIEKYGGWVDTITGMVPNVQTVKMIATAATEGLQSLTNAINGIRDKPLTETEKESLRSNYENFATSIGISPGGKLARTSEVIHQPTSGPKTTPPSSFEKISSAYGQTVDARGQPAFHGTINGRSVYLTLDPQSTFKEGFYRETDPVTGKQIDNKKYARIGNGYEFQEIGLKGGMKEADDLPGTSKSVAPKRPSDQVAETNSKKIKTLEPASSSTNWSEYLQENESLLNQYSEQAKVRQNKLYAEDNTDDTLYKYAEDQDKEGIDSTLVDLYTQNSNEYFNNHFRYDGAPGKIDNPEFIGHLADILELLPKTQEVTLYRGGSGGRGTSGEHFRTGKIKVGDQLVNTEFTSFTENPYSTKRFFGDNPSGRSGQYHYDNTSVVFVLENPQDARAIMPLSVTPEEAESLYTPGHRFIVKDIKTLSIDGHPLVQVQIGEGRSSGNTFDFRTGEPFDRQMMEKRIGSEYTERFFNR